jgi:hypothetical protein
MEALVEIRYAGVVIGQAQESRGAEGDAASFYISMHDPMPVGTLLRLRAGDREAPARVLRTIEAADAPGMLVRLIDDADIAASDWIPRSPAATEKVKSVANSEAKVASPAEPAAPAVPAQVEAAAVPAQVEAVALPAQVEAAVAPAAQPEPKIGKTGTVLAEAAQTETRPMHTLRSGREPISESELAAVPEAVPVAVGSSLTGALSKAAETNGHGQSENSVNDSAAVESAQGENSSAALSEPTPTTEELPPARPIAGPTGRRKSKRRR